MWSLPQAVQWERLGMTRTVARYVRAMVRSEAIPAAAEIVRIVPSSLQDRGNQQALAVAWNALNPGRRPRQALP